MLTYAVERLDTVHLEAAMPLQSYDLMSPFVWKEGKRYRMLFRGVPRPMTATSPTGIIFGADSDDGLHFLVRDRPAICLRQLATNLGVVCGSSSASAFRFSCN